MNKKVITAIIVTFAVLLVSVVYLFIEQKNDESMERFEAWQVWKKYEMGVYQKGLNDAITAVVNKVKKDKQINISTEKEKVTLILKGDPNGIF